MTALLSGYSLKARTKLHCVTCETESTKLHYRDTRNLKSCWKNPFLVFFHPKVKMFPTEAHHRENVCKEYISVELTLILFNAIVCLSPRRLLAGTLLSSWKQLASRTKEWLCTSYQLVSLNGHSHRGGYLKSNHLWEGALGLMV